MTPISKPVFNALIGPTIRTKATFKKEDTTLIILRISNSQGYVIEVGREPLGKSKWFFCENFNEAAKDWVYCIECLETRKDL